MAKMQSHQTNRANKGNRDNREIMMITNTFKRAFMASSALCLMGSIAQADIVQLDDVIIEFSLCVGNDCNNGESFGFDTVRLKENNVRLHFDDTSTTASFPQNDWRIIANDTSNGGSNYMAIEDSTAGRQIFRVDAGAPANALRVDSGGDVGIGVSNPVVELHVVDGDSPTLRLEQNGSSGFTPQTFDLVSNEANFFIRDVTNGSQLPFRIKPGADSDSLFIAADNDVGVGTDSPDAALHVLRTASGGAELLRLTANGTAFSSYEDSSVTAGNNTGRIWNVQNAGGEFRITTAPGGADEVEFSLDADGNITINGGLISTGGGGACTVADPCDAVFDPEIYTVPSIEDHAAEMWSNQFLPAVGPTGPEEPINMTVKMLRMLNELETAHIYIEQLHNRIKVLEDNS